MAGLEADTSSYSKPAIPTSPLDIAGKLGGLQQQSLQIDQQKLDQANQALTYLSRGMNSLGPNPTREQLIEVGKSVVDKGLAPPSMLDSMIKDIPTDPKLMPAFVDRLNTQTAQHQEMINHFRGQTQFPQTGQRTNIMQVPGSPNYPPTMRGSIPTEAPPTAETYDPNTGQKSTIGNVPLSAAPPMSGIGNRLQAAPPLPQRPDVSAAPPLVPGKPQDRVGQSGSFPTAPHPMFEEGKKQYTADQEMATQRLQSLKPALQALPLMKGLTTGIGTETYNKALAGLSNLGWLPEGATDKVANYQIVNKKLADYVRSSPLGQRSDAAQILSQSASPDPKGQINQALVKLTKDAIALDRSNAIRHMSFVSEGKDGRFTPRGDYHNYGNERAKVPEKIDERALSIDILEDGERKRLLDRMEKEQNTPQGKKFKYTLELAHKLNLFQ